MYLLMCDLLKIIAWAVFTRKVFRDKIHDFYFRVRRFRVQLSEGRPEMGILLSSEEVFALAKEIEKSGHAFYTTVAETAETTDLAEFFTFLADQEIAHYRFFDKLSENAPKLSVSAEEWEQTSAYIRATTDSRFFIGEDKAIQLAKGAATAGDAIDIAIGFEKDTLLYFYELLNVTPEGSKSAAEQIVEEEKRHVKMLAEKKAELG
jgi:rubrerythrin